jgi:hypothetical protein
VLRSANLDIAGTRNNPIANPRKEGEAISLRSRAALRNAGSKHSS